MRNFVIQQGWNFCRPLFFLPHAASQNPTNMPAFALSATPAGVAIIRRPSVGRLGAQVRGLRGDGSACMRRLPGRGGGQFFVVVSWPSEKVSF